MADLQSYGLAVLSDDERKFVEDLDALGCAIWVGSPDTDSKRREFRRPKGWQDAIPAHNEVRLGFFETGRCLCANTGKRVVVVDVDPRNGGDIDTVRAWLDGLGIRTFAEVITPSGGRHFYIAGCSGLPTVHGKLPGLRGVDLQSDRANIFLPGTLRPKYDGKGYEIVFNDLDTLQAVGDHDGVQALTACVGQHLPKRPVANVPGQPWDGTPPDYRQQRYLTKVLTEEVKSVAGATPGRRNEGLNAAAFNLGGYIAGAGLDRQVVEESLTQAATDCGLADDDGMDSVESTISSGITSGMENPRVVPNNDGPDPRTQPGHDNTSGPAAENPDAAPLALGDQLLDDLLATVNRYVKLPDDHAAVAVTLWTAATHAIDCWNAAPRLVISSPQKRCGKTRALDVIGGLCHKPLITVNASAAAIFRSLTGDRPPTLIIDEADAIFGNKRSAEQNEDLRALLNAGYQRNRPALRCVGNQQTPTEYPTFAMVALAGIGAMPDTIIDRAVNITMQRRTTGEKVSQFRSRRDEPVLHDQRDKLAVWAQAHLEELTNAVPDMPVDDRAADTWEPLIAVADVAGGHWPDLARAACTAFVDGADDADEERSLDIRLLTDIRHIFAEEGVQFLSSTDLVNSLKDITESPWEDYEYNPSKLAYRLRAYGIKPGHSRDKSARGYSLEQFHDAFERYTRPDPSSPSATRA